MKLLSLKCPHCGANVELSENSAQVRCRYCGAVMTADDEVSRVRFDNANSAGYEFEMGRIRARREAESTLHQAPAQPAVPDRTARPKPARKRHTFWWVMGWIFIFPIPLTVICVRSKKLRLPFKILIILAAWALYLFIAAGAA